MTINVNETSINSAVEGVDAGGITHLFEAKKIVSKVKDAVANLQGAEARGRKAMAKMVAALVEMGLLILVMPKQLLRSISCASDMDLSQ